jgi:tRNA(His) guanylyltransferase
MLDQLGDRMKGYESVSSHSVMSKSYTVIRVDGRAFHTYCRGLKKPFDEDYIQDFDNTAAYLCKEIQNCKLAYTQSDEMTFLLCDFDTYNTSPFFGGNIQKISSVVASMASAKFNQLRFLRNLGAPSFLDKRHSGLEDDVHYYDPGHLQEITQKLLAVFDCRVYNVPSRMEAMNSFIWRNQDCIRNAVSSYAQRLYSPKQLHGVKTDAKIAKIEEALKISWDTVSPSFRFGRLVVPDQKGWKIIPAWKFTEDNSQLLRLIPTNNL